LQILFHKNLIAQKIKAKILQCYFLFKNIAFILCNLIFYLTEDEFYIKKTETTILVSRKVIANPKNKKAVLTIKSCRWRGRRAAPKAAPSPAFLHSPACPGRRPARPATQLHKDIAQFQSFV